MSYVRKFKLIHGHLKNSITRTNCRSEVLLLQTAIYLRMCHLRNVRNLKLRLSLSHLKFPVSGTKVIGRLWFLFRCSCKWRVRILYRIRSDVKLKMSTVREARVFFAIIFSLKYYLLCKNCFMVWNFNIRWRYYIILTLHKFTG